MYPLRVDTLQISLQANYDRQADLNEYVWMCVLFIEIKLRFQKAEK